MTALRRSLLTTFAATALLLSLACGLAAAEGATPGVRPTASLRLEPEGCFSSLVVDYSDFGPMDFLVGYVEVDSQPGSGFYVAPGSGSGSVRVTGPLGGAITADVAVDPFTADAALLDSFAMIPPGYNPEWFSTPQTWPLPCDTRTPDPSPTFEPCGNACNNPSPEPTPPPEPSALPTPRATLPPTSTES